MVGFGRTHAFFCGWYLTLGYTCIVALNASALALLFRKLMPDVVQQGYLYSVAGWDVYLVEIIISMVALAVFAYLNIRGTALSGQIQFIACVIMLVAVACILVAVIASPQVVFSNALPAFPKGVNPIAAIAAIVAIAPWAFIGFDNVPQAAEEFDFPPSKAMRLIVLALLAAALLYAAMLAAVAMSAPWEALVAGESAWGTADALTGVMGGAGMLLLTIGITMGVSTGLNGFYVSASRILLGMGRAQMVPKMFARLHPKYKTPYIGIIFVGAVCLISPWFGRAALTWVVDMSAVGVTVAYLYTCLCAFRLFRTSGAPAPRGHPGRHELDLQEGAQCAGRGDIAGLHGPVADPRFPGRAGQGIHAGAGRLVAAGRRLLPDAPQAQQDVDRRPGRHPGAGGPAPRGQRAQVREPPGNGVGHKQDMRCGVPGLRRKSWARHTTRLCVGAAGCLRGAPQGRCESRKTRVCLGFSARKRC